MGHTSRCACGWADTPSCITQCRVEMCRKRRGGQGELVNNIGVCPLVLVYLFFLLAFLSLHLLLPVSSLTRIHTLTLTLASLSSLSLCLTIYYYLSFSSSSLLSLLFLFFLLPPKPVGCEDHEIRIRYKVQSTKPALPTS